MQIRTKITTIFILLISLFLIIIFVLIYTFFKSHNEGEFYNRLFRRATIAAQTYLEKDEMNTDVYETLKLEHQQTLPDEKEIIVPVIAGNNMVSADSDHSWPPTFLENIFSNGKARMKMGERYHAGLLYVDNEGEFIIVISARDQYGVEKLKYLSNLLIITYGICLFFIFALGQYFSKQALSPISKIINKANTIKAENLYLRLDPIKNNDELSELTNTFNEMLDRLQISFGLQSNFINNASHELRNPLTAILGQTEIALLKDRPAEEYKTTLMNVQNEANKLDTLVNGLLELAKADFETSGLSISAIRIDETLIEIKKNIDVVRQCDVIINYDQLPENENLLTVMGSESLLKVALTNLLENACKFSEGKEVSVKLLADTRQITLIIRDEGIGIPSEDLANIFEPFYRGSNVREMQGFGFGLPLAFRIIKFHSGDITISSQVGKGTIVKVKLPNYNMVNKTFNKF